LAIALTLPRDLVQRDRGRRADVEAVRKPIDRDLDDVVEKI